MGFLDWFKRERKITDYTPEELRREEGRLQIRENQTIAKVEKLEVERQQIFQQGAGVKSPVRRRILARKYEEKKVDLARLEKELNRLSKEAMTVSAIRFRLERRAEGESAILKKIGGGEIEALRELFEDESIDGEMYGERLTEMLGAVAEPAGDPLDGLGEEGQSVLDIWQRMDQGDIETVEEGLREAQERSEEGLAEPE
ncbi:MAG: hypothetical protein ACYS99_18225 [Planctomycetota bacterium]|jgi:hypothetical protein